MTAIISVRKATSLDMLVDAAGYDERGIVHQITSKAEVIPEIGCSLAGRGVLTVLRAFALLVRQRCRSLDDLLDQFPQLMADTERAGTAEIGESFYNHEILIAGWSDREKAPLHFFTGAHGRFPGADGGLYSAGPVFGLGPIEPLTRLIERYSTGDGADDDLVEKFDPEADGVPVFESMRAIAEELTPGGVISHGVGGFLEHLSITATGIDRRIVRVWPDAVGQPIRPRAGVSQAVVKLQHQNRRSRRSGRREP